mmetsp:Transcript_15727/g.37158  ORF Transcript_15727/g.37158 Transcript_15727/m.37158 type:complete len:229 (-) Transcript_15727:283-969(-)
MHKYHIHLHRRQRSRSPKKVTVSGEVPELIPRHATLGAVRGKHLLQLVSLVATVSGRNSRTHGRTNSAVGGHLNLNKASVASRGEVLHPDRTLLQLARLCKLAVLLHELLVRFFVEFQGRRVRRQRDWQETLAVETAHWRSDCGLRRQRVEDIAVRPSELVLVRNDDGGRVLLGKHHLISPMGLGGDRVRLLLRDRCRRTGHRDQGEVQRLSGVNKTERLQSLLLLGQ